MCDGIKPGSPEWYALRDEVDALSDVDLARRVLTITSTLPTKQALPIAQAARRLIGWSVLHEGEVADLQAEVERLNIRLKLLLEGEDDA